MSQRACNHGPRFCARYWPRPLADSRLLFSSRSQPLAVSETGQAKGDCARAHTTLAPANVGTAQGWSMILKTALSLVDTERLSSEL